MDMREPIPPWPEQTSSLSLSQLRCSGLRGWSRLWWPESLELSSPCHSAWSGWGDCFVDAAKVVISAQIFSLSRSAGLLGSVVAAHVSSIAVRVAIFSAYCEVWPVVPRDEPSLHWDWPGFFLQIAASSTGSVPAAPRPRCGQHGPGPQEAWPHQGWKAVCQPHLGLYCDLSGIFRSS